MNKIENLNHDMVIVLLACSLYKHDYLNQCNHY